MELKSEHHLHSCGESMPDIVIHGDGDKDSEFARMTILSGELTAKVDLTWHAMHRLRLLLEDVLKEHDDERRCPACGYTLNDVQMHGDHKICRMYPYFEFERPDVPETEAI